VGGAFFKIQGSLALISVFNNALQQMANSLLVVPTVEFTGVTGSLNGNIRFLFN